ncbi:hypothetical protein LG288_09330 [Idiomarina seosinensis]|uniref:hypothetical protein n=1 Tax=Idiomarina seosinensis TaxID=281739 RepID=UPI00384B09F0
MEGDVIFWLKYSDKEMNKCASLLLQESGRDLGITNIKNAKELLLNFCSYAFNVIDADFLSLNESNPYLSQLLSQHHRTILSSLFVDYIDSKKVLKPYIYTLKHAHTNEVHNFTDNLSIYGSGQIERLLIDIKNRTGIDLPSKAVENELNKEPIGQYKQLLNSSAILVYARSVSEATETFDRLFGALCITIDKPFIINQVTVDNRINFLESNGITTCQIRCNLPSVYEINITPEVISDLKKILKSDTKRMTSALSFIAHGWTHDKRERFLNHFIALDALYGTERSNKTAIVGGVSRDASNIEDIESKIKAIYSLRSKFIHGEISIFSDHGKYPKFIHEHGIEPVESLFSVLKTCIFNYQGPYKVPQLEGVNLRVPKELETEFKMRIAEYNKK